MVDVKNVPLFFFFFFFFDLDVEEETFSVFVKFVLVDVKDTSISFLVTSDKEDGSSDEAVVFGIIIR